MKNYFTLFIICISAITFSNCKKDKIPPKVEPKVDSEGLTQEIRNLVPDSILNTMRGMGMTINGGENPPVINGTYYAAPFKLESSNRPNDYAGMSFADYEVTFQEQDNNKLSVKVDYINGPESGNALGSYIVGTDCKFSVFVEINSTNAGTTAKMIHVISGTFVENGIEDLQFANFMADNHGNAGNIWIENGQGRVIIDEDEFSPMSNTKAQWSDYLPDCPCTYYEVQQLSETTCPDGTWSACGDADQNFHPGATFEARWFPRISLRPGQQCTYDASGNLITGGLAAGSPDNVSPQYCEFISTSTPQHYLKDVLPWGDLSYVNILGGSPSDVIPCWQYLNNWRANNGSGCSLNKVTPIDHCENMKKMIGNISCKEATVLIRGAKESPNILIDAELRSFIIGESDILSVAQLSSKLQNWKNLRSCQMYPNDPLCKVIDKAIVNLQ